MKDFIGKHHRILFFASWFLINLVQAATTGLMDDEAYYWVYSQFSAWGYFDHPPMIAVLIKAGTSIFNGELGVRFFIVVLNTLTLLLIYNLLRPDDRNDKLFYAICYSLMLAPIGGILAVPDLPLLFFAALYFYLYKRFLENTGLINALLLGVGIALMLYSKYHGILLVFFTLLSNLQLFKRPHTYVAAVTALVLFYPHISWQLNHDLPSVQYHLFERNASSYQPGFTLEYVFGQLALAGPIAGWLLLWAAFRYKTGSQFERTLKFNLAGIYIFFLLSTLKGRVEANWTVPAFVSLIVLSYYFLLDREKQRRWLYKMVPATIVLVLVVRVFMAIDIERVSWISKDEFHSNEQWVKEVNETSNGLPVVILNSYQLPSKYFFYTGEKAFGLNTAYYRRNNYNFWPLEDSLFGKRAFVMGRKDSMLFTHQFAIPVLKESGATVIDNYYSFSRIQFVDPELRNDSLYFTARTPAGYLKLMQNRPYADAKIQLAVITPNVGVEYLNTGLTVMHIRKTEQQLVVPFPVNIPKDKVVKLVIESAVKGHPSLNSTAVKR